MARPTTDDLLAGAHWECAATSPGAVADAGDLDAARLSWIPASVPGTAGAAAVAAYGDRALWDDYDGADWWFRTSFDTADGDGSWVVELGGLATVADVWLNGVHLLHSENMFLEHRLDIDRLAGSNRLVLRFAALTPLLAKRRPRPRWRSPRMVHQNLRWLRTTLMGRLLGWVVTPPPVGPWRPISIRKAQPVEVLERSVRTRCTPSGGGVVEVALRVTGVDPAAAASIRVGDRLAPASLADAGDATIVTATVELDQVKRWWPHTHGPQPLYDVSLEIAVAAIDLGLVGFRTIEVDRSDGGFTLVCNGVPIFCRGACWTPPDPVSFVTDDEQLLHSLELYRAAGFNMVRLVGEISYETEAFLDRCDELGLMLWQDAMFAFYDAPADDPEYVESLTRELRQVFGALGGRPCLAAISGGSDTEEQAQFMGGPPEVWRSPLAYTLIPQLVDELLPGTPYIASTPGESPLPTMINAGVSHYYGVGAYTRPLDDARRAAPRFVAECLSFATPPEPLDDIEHFALPRAGMGHHAEWKNAIHSDAHASWDQEDVRDFYTKAIFDVDVFDLRHRDPEHSLALARATSAYVFDHVLTEWRRPGSACMGSLVFHWHDLRYGAGLGLIDSLGRPKSSWYAAKRVMQPVAVLLTDEGLNGLGLHVVNDRAEDFVGALRMELVVNGSLRIEPTDVAVTIPARGGCTVETATVFGGFRDLSYAHQFGKPAFDAVIATLIGSDGEPISEAVYLPTNHIDVESDLGLAGVVRRDDAGDWEVELTTQRLARWVTVEVPGFVPLDGWFHLPPGQARVVKLTPQPGAPATPRPVARAVNLSHSVRLELADTSG